MRASVYARLIEKNPRRRSELERRAVRLQAVYGTLQWLSRNEAKIREALGSAHPCEAASESSNAALERLRAPD